MSFTSFVQRAPTVVRLILPRPYRRLLDGVPFLPCDVLARTPRPYTASPRTLADCAQGVDTDRLLGYGTGASGGVGSAASRSATRRHGHGSRSGSRWTRLSPTTTRRARLSTTILPATLRLRRARLSPTLRLRVCATTTTSGARGDQQAVPEVDQRNDQARRRFVRHRATDGELE